MENDPEREFMLKLESRLKELGAWHRFIEKPQSTVHTADAAGITGLDLHRISKNLMAKTSDGNFVALIIPGDMRVDYKAAAAALGVKNISLVPFAEADKVSGYPPGGTPSIGYQNKIAVVVDEELMKLEAFYCGGGSTLMLLEVRSAEVVKFNDAKIARISKQG